MSETFVGTSAAQARAIENIRNKAEAEQVEAKQAIDALLQAEGIGATAEDLVSKIKQTAVVTVNFHPDRLCNDGRAVAAALYEDGIYRTQFETGISNGGLNRIVGGRRDVWEKDLWGDVYLADGVSPSERPKYGGLNLMDYSDGACPRFGSCHLRLKQSVSASTSFTFGDSNRDEKEGHQAIGLIDVFEPVLAEFLTDASKRGVILGKRDISLKTWVNELLALDENSKQNYSHNPLGRALDEYIEAQIHSPISLAKDVDGVILDPSFRGTATGKLLENLASKYDLNLEWHSGFRIDIKDVPSDFRVQELPAFARFVGDRGGNDTLDAAIIGQAAVSIVSNPKEWEAWGTADEALQLVKYLWHTLVVFG
jgi:Protein of unknown function (DUF3626)